MLVFGMTAPGCQGNSTGATLEEYFLEVAEAGRDLDERLEGHRFEPDLESEEDPFDVIREWFDEFVVMHRNYVEALARIDPPVEVAEVHAELVAATDDLSDAVAHAVDGIAEVESTSEVEEFLEQFGDETNPEVREASERWSAACSALQEIALANDIRVYIQC